MGIFLVAKGRGEDLAGGVVDGREERQARGALVESGVRAAVELDEEPLLGHALPTAPVARGTSPSRAGHAGLAQDAAERGAREREAFPFAQELVQVVVVDAHVARGGQAHDAGADTIRDPVDGRPSAIAMDEGGHAPGTKGGAQAADLANRSSQELCALGHQKLTTVEGVEDFQALLGAVRHGDHASPSSV